MSNIADYNTSELYKTIIGHLEEQVREPLYPGDERRIFGEALVSVIAAVYAEVDDKAKQRLLGYARGQWLDALGARTATYRIASAPATTTLRYTRSVGGMNAMIIPAGTRATGDGLRYFATDVTATIDAGAESVDIPARAVEGGAACNNIPAGGINQQVDLIPNIRNVANITETIGGNDGEPYTEDGDNAYRARIQLAPNRYSTAGPSEAYRYFALGADANIVDVAVTSPEACHILLSVLIDPGAEQSPATLDRVLAACDDRKVRPMTDIVVAGWAEAVEYGIDITCYIPPGTAPDMNAAISSYIEWQGGRIGRAVNPDQLRKRVLDAGALRLDIRAPVVAEVGATQVAFFSGDMNVDYRAVSE